MKITPQRNLNYSNIWTIWNRYIFILLTPLDSPLLKREGPGVSFSNKYFNSTHHSNRPSTQSTKSQTTPRFLITPDDANATSSQPTPPLKSGNIGMLFDFLFFLWNRPCFPFLKKEGTNNTESLLKTVLGVVLLKINFSRLDSKIHLTKQNNTYIQLTNLSAILLGGLPKQPSHSERSACLPMAGKIYCCNWKSHKSFEGMIWLKQIEIFWLFF